MGIDHDAIDRGLEGRFRLRRCDPNLAEIGLLGEVGRLNPERHMINERPRIAIDSEPHGHDLRRVGRQLAEQPGDVVGRFDLGVELGLRLLPQLMCLRDVLLRRIGGEGERRLRKRS